MVLTYFVYFTIQSGSDDLFVLVSRIMSGSQINATNASYAKGTLNK